MAAVEVCVVAWLTWGVVAGLLGVVWGGSGAVWGLIGSVETRDPKYTGGSPGGDPQRFPKVSGPILDGFWVDPGSILGRSWGDFGAILGRF